MLAAERERQNLAQWQEERRGHRQGEQARRGEAASEAESRRGECESGVESASGHETSTVRREMAGSPASNWRPRARPNAATARRLPRRSVPRARSRAAAAHHGSHAAAAMEFMKAPPYESIIPEKAKATPARNADAVRELEPAGERPRPEERPEHVEQVVQVEGGGRRQHELEQEGRVEQHGVRVGQHRLPSGGRCIHERNLAGREHLDGHAAPRPVGDLRVAKDEPPRAEDLRQQGQGEQDDDAEARESFAPASRHCDSVYSYHGRTAPMLETDFTKPDSSSVRLSLAQKTAEARRQRALRFDALAEERDRWKARNSYYYESIERLCRRFISPGSRVLELGCGTGDLLAALAPDPAGSLGIDFSGRTVERARLKHPGLRFAQGDAETLSVPAEPGFDFILASDLVGHLDDVYGTFRRMRAACHARTRLVVTYYNFLWEGVLQAAEGVGLKMPQRHQNWIGMQDLENLLFLGGFHVTHRGWELLLPKRVPLLAPLINAVAPHTPGLRHLCLVHYAVAEVAPAVPPRLEAPRVSVVVPCRNEEGNIDEAVERIPEMGAGTEILFVDGASTDGTVARIEAAIVRCRGVRDIRLIHQVERTGPAVSAENPDRMLKLGKGDAVRKGFAAASGRRPHDPRCGPDRAARGPAQLRRGPERGARPSSSTARAWSTRWRTRPCASSTSAGTSSSASPSPGSSGSRSRTRSAAPRPCAGATTNGSRPAASYFGDFDPFGDFDLLFGAARLKLRIVDMPVRYARRTAGVSKVRLLSHGWLLVRMSWIAFQKFKWNRWLGRDRREGTDR